jgi:hypothetical protein
MSIRRRFHSQVTAEQGAAADLLKSAAKLCVEAVEKASGKSRLRDAGESDLTECATIDVLRPR